MTCFAYLVFEVAGLYRGGRGLTPFPLGKSRALWFCNALPRISSPGGIILCPVYLLICGNVCGPRLLGSFSREFWWVFQLLWAVPPVIPLPVFTCPRRTFPQHGTCGPVFIYTGYSPLPFSQLKNSSPLLIYGD